ncbi:YqiA/YcfP family alpha/beta fold hydrolase [Salegentibacter sp. F188]|uniref:YqiA/YcfP family alpha/beta fold hydrolase n=1 Tax=Autumnicola patrickiae TaxID=3075591 RepID=A0ABU3E0P7_9FLAO|nr:YqiA/YcfP family alpha/beta fold hydrolase [Salegentibacter sp. F188]MDT0689573.1 YqiA/YcfP family alpha/beta fold hydrolase [Salegentibacter sp. F188]
MNILYLHGLDSKLSSEKREILEKFGTVLAPDLDYYQNPNAIDSILQMYSEVEINVVIGSSMGGFAGYHVANAIFRPALLFNPALIRRSVPQNIPKEKESYNNLKQIIIGQRDEVVSPQDTLNFLVGEFNPVTDFYLRLVPRLGHRIPVELFEEEVKSFFKKLCY